MSSYYLLTGATGLLGRYLLRDLSLADVRVAVVVRPTRLATARERVESALVDMETELDRPLPRPVVLQGDLTLPRLGIDKGGCDWVRRNVRGILHNAASLTFLAEGPDAEPYASNVRGMENVLELARTAAIRQFHHVSTAYVCGLRRGTIRETESDVGQEMGNDYERSKLAAERLVTAADWLDGPTIYRPAIVLGDSRTGFTNTFHGFYRPLQIVHAMINKLSISEFQPVGLLDVLGMQGTERKNLVTVDWVSAVIAHLLRDRRHHGRVYHLTPREPVRLVQILNAAEQAIRQFSIDWQRVGAPRSGGPTFAAFQSQFREQLDVYRAYWRDDPVFDATNTLCHAAELPCPAIDGALLLKLCRFAIENNFWWSRGEKVTPTHDVHAHLARYVGEAPVDGNGFSVMRTVGLQVNGCGGGQWKLHFNNGHPPVVEEGLGVEHAAMFYLHVDAFRALATGELDADRAIREGAVALTGSELDEKTVIDLLRRIAAP